MANHLKKTWVSRVLTLVLMLFVAHGLGGPSAFADGGDFQLDFVASAPLTYNHTFGGGAYDDRAVGRDKDIVESLEGGDFLCGDLVTYLTQISVDAGATGAQTIELDYAFAADSTGKSGVAFVDIVNVGVNYPPVVDGDDGVDTGISDDAGSTATLNAGSEVFTGGGAFTKGAELLGTVTVTDLEAGETVVVRIDVRLGCDGRDPTGNLYGRLRAARVVSPAEDAISGGEQTIPLKNVGDIKTPPPPPKP